MPPERWSQVRHNTEYTVSILLACLSLLASFTSAVIAIVIYTDIQLTPEACECTQNESRLLLQQMEALIQRHCAAPSSL